MTDRIELVEFGPGHFDQLIAWSPTPEFLLQWAGPSLRFPLDHAQLQSLIDGPARLFTVTEEGRVVGHAEIGRIDEVKGHAWLMRILIGDPADRGRGLGRKVIAELIRIAFRELQLQRLYLHVLKSNAPARSLYESFGFEACDAILPRPEYVMAMVLERAHWQLPG